MWNCGPHLLIFSPSSQEIKQNRLMGARRDNHPHGVFWSCLRNFDFRSPAATALSICWTWCINWESNWKTNLVLTWYHPKWGKKQSSFHFTCGGRIPMSQDVTRAGRFTCPFRVSFANRFFLYLLLFAPHWALHIRVNPPGFLLVRSSSSHHNDHISLSKITLLLPYHYQTLERFLCANRSTWKAGVSDNQVSYRGLHLRVGCARLDVHTAVQGISPANLAYVASPKIWRGWYVHMQRLRSFEQQLTTLRLYPTYVCLCLLI